MFPESTICYEFKNLYRPSLGYKVFVYSELPYDSNLVKCVYATIMEQDTIGFDGDRYDFQMIVPENGNQSFSGATAYYIYIELT